MWASLWAHCGQACGHIVGKLVGSVWERLWALCGKACGLIVGTLAGKLWARLSAHSGHACRHIVGTLCRPPRTKPTVAAACLVHIPPVNKRSETKRVLIQLATEGWEGCRVAESSSPSSLQPRTATVSLGPWCAPQKVGSRSASVSMARKMLFPFWKISCTVFSIPRPTLMFHALPWNDDLMASKMSSSVCPLTRLVS